MTGETVYQEETERTEIKESKDNKGTKAIQGYKAILVRRVHLEMMGEMVHQEEMEEMERLELMGEWVYQDYAEQTEWMENQERKESVGGKEIVGHQAHRVHRVHLAPLARVGWSTHAGGGPRVRVDREQSWSTAEELEGVTSGDQEVVPTTSACQTTHSTQALHLECRATVLCMVLSTK